MVEPLVSKPSMFRLEESLSFLFQPGRKVRALACKLRIEFDDRSFSSIGSARCQILLRAVERVDSRLSTRSHRQLNNHMQANNPPFASS